MKDVVLWNIIAPSAGISGAEKLYSSKEGEWSFPLQLAPGEEIDFSRHINLFPACRVREYTAAEKAFLTLDFEGELSAEISYLSEGKAPSWDRLRVLSGEPVEIDLSRGDLVGVSVSTENGATILGGCFSVTVDEPKRVKLAHVVCTYHREDDVRAKHALIMKYLEAHPEMKDSYSLIVIDNGASLVPTDFPGAEVIASPNYGGSAGFSRGILKALEDPDITDILLNDDDAVLEPEMVFRAMAFRSILRPEYGSAALGGAMLLRNEPSRVHELGAVFRGLNPMPLAHGIDVSTQDGCLSLCDSGIPEYFGWWFADFPRTSFERFGLPLPYFYKVDDGEFGSRLAGAPEIPVPGISVWHPSFRLGYTPASVYYSTRNTLATAAIRGKLTKDAIKGFYNDVLCDTACLKYQYAEARLKAAEDFLEGPVEVFESFLDGPEKVPDCEWSDPEELRKELDIRESKERPRWFRFCSMNGLLLSAKGDREASITDRKTAHFYRAGKVLYLRGENRGTICSRDRGRASKDVRAARKMRRRLKSARKMLWNEYAAAFPKYSSKEWWESVFSGLQKKRRSQ